MSDIAAEDYLAHYGILRRSGRYPWGSGETQSIRNKTFLDTVADLKRQGLTDTEIARGFNTPDYPFTTTQLRALRSVALAQQKQEKILTAQRLRDKGWGYTEIGRRMGLPESTVRAYLRPGEKDKTDVALVTANMLKDELANKKYLDVGKGVSTQLGITSTRLNTALAALKEEGYEVHTVKIDQLTTGNYTTTKVLGPRGTTKYEIQKNISEVKVPQHYSEDNGRSFLGIQPPISISSRRIAVKWGDEGGAEADGVIYVRPNVKDLSIGGKRYAQVRIMVDKTHFLKGMAVYKDDLPEGVDILFNTNKPNTGRKKDAMKALEEDKDFPFGSVVRQIHGPDGKVSSAMNIVGMKPGSGEEGSWDTWSKNLSSQILSKQNPKLIENQLQMTYDRRRKEFDEIMSLTNPVVKQTLLMRFGDEADSASVHLRAANMPRQATKVILPLKTVKPGEIYAPTFKDGERVVLIRFPHAGKFEIPEVTVNNRNPEGRKLLGTGKNSPRHDAIGIHPSVAKHLSGADFDGDFVLVIPNKQGKIEKDSPLKSLENFDPIKYKIPKDSPAPRMTEGLKGREMGDVSNLITDMTIKGASSDELARAVRHSMVVIDAVKHELDYKLSEKDNGIRALKAKYQGKSTAGANTLISKARSPIWVPDRVARKPAQGGPVDPKTGKKIFVPTGKMIRERKRITDPKTGESRYIDTGRLVPKEIRSKKLAETDDAHTLSSGTKVEDLYADHSNRLKALANESRKEALKLKPIPYSPSANKVYAPQVASLKAQLNIAKKNAPLERQALIIARAKITAKRQANPNLDKDDVKKIKQMALNEARNNTGAKKVKIVIKQDEWNAIQAGAIRSSTLKEILSNSDLDTVRRLALPKTNRKLTSTMMRRAQSMLANGFTQTEVAEALGVGLTTLKVGLDEQ